MRVLCVAEKPSIAKSISQILSGGQFSTVILLPFGFVSGAHFLSIPLETST